MSNSPKEPGDSIYCGRCNGRGELPDGYKYRMFGYQEEKYKKCPKCLGDKELEVSRETCTKCDGNSQYRYYELGSTDHGSGSYPARNYLSDCSACQGTGRKLIRKNSLGCFLTTAATQHMGLPDNCPELESMRFLRDYVVRKTQEGLGEIDLYYREAPGIVEEIDASSDPDGIYGKIFTTLIQVRTCIGRGNYTEAADKYRRLFNALRQGVDSVKS